MPAKNQTMNDNQSSWVKAKDLYVKLLETFYDRFETLKAKSYALSLLRLVDELDPLSKTLPGTEYRALIAEVDDDIAAAIRYREELVDKIDDFLKKRRLEELAMKPADYSDQLDLLACLYCQSNRLAEAEATVEKSASVCRSAGIPFDGEDVRKQIKRMRKTATRAATDGYTSGKTKNKKNTVNQRS
jgi:hypothetical protein